MTEDLPSPLADKPIDSDAWLVERGTMPDQRIARLVDVDADDCPYFAIVLVHGQGRRPELAGGE